MSTPLSTAFTDLPIEQILSQVRGFLTSQNKLVISATPGAGKSTLLPLALLHEPWLKGKKMLLLEPRRLAAASVAKRMAFLMGEKVGQTIGYRIRFESKIGANTRIEVVTEGILTRMLQEDNALESYGLVIFDEFHERNIHADLSLAFCLESQQILRPDLKLIVMSATLDIPGLSHLLKAQVVECPGRIFPIQTIYTGVCSLENLPLLCAQTVIRALRETEGDILAFLPGQASIKKCKDLLNSSGRNTAIHTLYGQLSLEEQTAAVSTDPKGRRKIVLATSIAETSLTIEGVQVVIDSGFTRKAVFNPKSGLSGLQTVPVTLDAADQRRGRAGRLGPGICYRMWSKATEERMVSYRTPEILDIDLMSFALDLLRWGVTDTNQLNWLSLPPAKRFLQAQQNLAQIGASFNGKISAHGRQMQQLPCHPRIAHMLLLAAEKKQVPLAADIAALLEERDPLSTSSEADINLRIAYLRKIRQEKHSDKHCSRIIKTATAYRRFFRAEENNEPVDPYLTGLLLSLAYPERIAGNSGGDGLIFYMANGQRAILNNNDSLKQEDFITIAQIDARLGQGKIFLAAPIRKEELITRAELIKTVTWDSHKGGLCAQEEWKIGSLTVEARALSQIPEDLANEALMQAIMKDGLNLLNFNASVEQWQNRVMSLRKWNPEDAWPLVDSSTLLSKAIEWLSPYLVQVRKTDELKKIDLTQALQRWLSYEQQTALQTLAPTSFCVPSGSTVNLTYMPDGAPPILAVRLQEVFGMLDTPRINAGKTSIVLHLLSPGFKAVQITTDLRNFWNSTYFEVKKELKRRYPKHSWPENPFEAKAVKGIQRSKHM
jgi:ATP-dependent helicase HrpB